MWIKLIFIEKKGFALGLALKQMRKATQKWPIVLTPKIIVFSFRLMESMPRTTLDQAIRIQVSVHMSLCSHVSLFKVF